MFDRLIIPYPADPEERKRWSGAGWAPDRHDEMLAVLRTGGNEHNRRAITVPWNKDTNDLFDRRAQTAGIVDLEANFRLTKRLLAEDLLPEPGPGVTGVNALASYRSVGASASPLLPDHSPRGWASGQSQIWSDSGFSTASRLSSRVKAKRQR